MPSGLSPTSYALLGLLVFDAETGANGMTGYELKQRADKTLRFYWVAPAMSQIYTELDRLHEHGLVTSSESGEGRRPARRFRISSDGRAALRAWLHTPDVDAFPALKHPVALRLLMGQLIAPAEIDAMLGAYLDRLDERSAELQVIRDSLEGNPEVRYPARVAEWGLAYFQAERDVTDRLRREIAAEADDQA